MVIFYVLYKDLEDKDEKEQEQHKKHFQSEIKVCVNEKESFALYKLYLL